MEHGTRITIKRPSFLLSLDLGLGRQYFLQTFVGLTISKAKFSTVVGFVNKKPKFSAVVGIDHKKTKFSAVVGIGCKKTKFSARFSAVVGFTVEFRSFLP